MSRLIKSQWTTLVQSDKKVISIKMINSEASENNNQAFLDNSAEKEILIENAKIEAANILKEARNQIENDYEQLKLEQRSWEQEKIRISEEAEKNGFHKGLEEGRKQGYEDYLDTIQFAQNVVELSKQDYQKHLDSSEKTILNLAVKVAEKIIGKSFNQNKADFLSFVKRALKEAREYKEIQLHVHPTKYAFLLGEKEELLSIFPRETNLYIFPDDSLIENSCIIESINGRIDASIDSQLSQLKEKLIEIMESE